MSLPPALQSTLRPPADVGPPAAPTDGWSSGLFTGQFLDLILPLECAGCRAEGVRWCRACAACLEPTGARVSRQPLGLVPGGDRSGAEVLVAAEYAGPLRSALIAYKDGGRWDLATVLAPLVADLVRAGHRELVARAAQRNDRDPAAPVLVVPVPSRRSATRRRGERPVELLARRACGDGSARPVRALRVGRVADQSGLGAAGRRRNLDGAMWVDRRRQRVVSGALCLLVDDIVTTGSTLIEGSRALLAAGARDVVAVAVAATRHPGGSDPRPGRMDPSLVEAADDD